MTRKDYKLIAETITKLGLSKHEQQRVALEFSQALVGTNPNYNAAKFFRAAAPETLDA